MPVVVDRIEMVPETESPVPAAGAAPQAMGAGKLLERIHEDARSRRARDLRRWSH